MFSKTITAITELTRRAMLWLRKQEIAVAGHCEMCGRCCDSLNFTVGGEWVRTKKQFARLREKYPEYEYYEISGRVPGGVLKFRCKMLDENGLCSIHETRPDFCRNYPEVEMYLMGGDVQSHCGYRFETVPSFKRMLSREVKGGTARVAGDDPQPTMDSTDKTIE